MLQKSRPTSQHKQWKSLEPTVAKQQQKKKKDTKYENYVMAEVISLAR